MQVKTWTIIDEEQARLIIKCLDPAKAGNNADYDKVCRLKWDLAEHLGRVEKDRIVYKIKKMLEGLK